VRALIDDPAALHEDDLVALLQVLDVADDGDDGALGEEACAASHSHEAAVPLMA